MPRNISQYLGLDTAGPSGARMEAARWAWDPWRSPIAAALRVALTLRLQAFAQETCPQTEYVALDPVSRSAKCRVESCFFSERFLAHDQWSFHKPTLRNGTIFA